MGQKGKALKNTGRIRAVIAGVLLFALASPLPTAWADLSYDTVCAGVSAGSNDPTLQQKSQYCQAAQTAQTAADSDDTLFKVWAGVAAVCAATCVYSVTGHVTNKYVCMGAQAAGSLAEGAVTKQMAQAFMSAIQGIGGSYLMNSMINGSEKDVTKQKDIGACMGALTALMQSNAKKQDLSAQQQSVQSNLASAVSVQSQATATSGSSPNMPLSGATGMAMAQARAGNSGIQNLQAAPQPGASPPCGDTALQCAIASDSKLPGYVGTPRFANDFKKVAGQSLSDYLSKLDSSSSPSQAAMAALGGGSALTPDQTKKVASAFSAAEAQAGDSPTMYASAGRGGAHASEEDTSMTDFMSGLMNKLGPKGTAKKDSLALDVAFAHRSPSSVAEDKTISIFDRISYRYQFVGRRMLLGEGSSGGEK